ncbi:MAG: Uma2 family endonuclease [Deltaproteobacteria bacterium]|nr:Uma2 family endonuclease [Deltaproteobacteria bacterium]
MTPAVARPLISPPSRPSPRTPHRVTWEEFLALPDDDRRELINGQLVETETPTLMHERVVAELVADFVLWTRKHGGRALASGYKVRVV